MGAIAGAIRLDGSGADSALTGRMCAALAHRGACAAIDAGRSGLQIAFDGRLDDRQELATALGLDGSSSDSELVLAAYAAWGETCAERLAGDFAFVVRDPTTRSFICIRDIVGIKPFFYAVVDGLLVFASEMHALFQHPRLERVPNEGMVAQLLNDVVTSRDETLFRDIRRLPPAHVLRVRDGALAVQRYWTPRVAHAQDGRSDADYAAELKSILDDAVACRVDRPRTAAQLSGGLDSSAVVAIASTLPDGPDVHAYSLVFPGRPFDESGQIAEVVRRLRVRSTKLSVDAWDVEWFALQAEHDLEPPLGPTAGALAAMYAAVRADGFSSMLTGEGADEWFSGSALHFADLLARGAIPELAAELLHAPRRGVALRRLIVAGAWPLLPAVARTAIRPLARTLARRPSFIEWIDPAFAQRTALAERCRRREYDRESGMTRAAWDVAQYLDDGAQALAFEIADRIAARWAVEERHPFYDRRVIEFALALPESQRAARGVRKRVLRRAVEGLLPDAVRLRGDKADFTRLYLDWFAGAGGEAAYDRLAIADEGWVRPDVLKREYRQALAAVEAGRDAPSLGALWTVVALDAWFRAAVLRKPLDIPRAAAIS